MDAMEKLLSKPAQAATRDSIAAKRWLAKWNKGETDKVRKWAISDAIELITEGKFECNGKFIVADTQYGKICYDVFCPSVSFMRRPEFSNYGMA